MRHPKNECDEIGIVMAADEWQTLSDFNSAANSSRTETNAHVCGICAREMIGKRDTVGRTICDLERHKEMTRFAFCSMKSVHEPTEIECVI